MRFFWLRVKFLVAKLFLNYLFHNVDMFVIRRFFVFTNIVIKRVVDSEMRRTFDPV